MANPLVPIVRDIGGVCTKTMISEGALITRKAIGLFYVDVAKAWYVFMGSKRIACGVAVLACGTALVPGPHQGPFIVACAAAARGANKLWIKSLKELDINKLNKNLNLR